MVTILQMTRTRVGVGTSQGGNDGDLPPPPSPSVNEFFAQFLGNQRAMEETLRLIAQNTAQARSNIKGLNQISIAHSKTSKTLSPQSSKRPKNYSRQMSGLTR